MLLATKNSLQGIFNDMETAVITQMILIMEKHVCTKQQQQKDHTLKNIRNQVAKNSR